MRLVLVGPPGAGKGTQAQFLAAHYSIPHIATGDIFRANLKAGTELGNKAREFMDRGELVPDAITNEMVAARLEEADAVNGFLLDGWPRNVAQAEVLRAMMLDKKTPLNAVLEFSLPDDEIVSRLSSRRTCRDSVHHLLASISAQHVGERFISAKMTRLKLFNDALKSMQSRPHRLSPFIAMRDY